MTTTTENPHDPGPAKAEAAFDGPADVAAEPIPAGNGGSIRIGTA